jgi:hypothetical protein
MASRCASANTMPARRNATRKCCSKPSATSASTMPRSSRRRWRSSSSRPTLPVRTSFTRTAPTGSTARCRRSCSARRRPPMRSPAAMPSARRMTACARISRAPTPASSPVRSTAIWCGLSSTSIGVRRRSIHGSASAGPTRVDVDALVKNVDRAGAVRPAGQQEGDAAKDRPCRACRGRRAARRAKAAGARRSEPPQPPTRIDPALAVNSSEIQTKRDAIERVTNDLLGDWEPLVKPIVAGLQAEIAAASSVDDVKALLAKQFAGLNVEALTEQLARSAFAARLAGETNETL